MTRFPARPGSAAVAAVWVFAVCSGLAFWTAVAAGLLGRFVDDGPVDLGALARRATVLTVGSLVGVAAAGVVAVLRTERARRSSADRSSG